MAKKSRNDYYPDYSVFSEGNGDVLKRAVKELSKVLGTATEKYKDTVFRMLLNDKKVALEVYNAINGSDYDDPDDIRLPEPKFVVFYNGNEKVPKRYEMRLSKAYERQTEDPSLELKIDVVNINPGCNDELLRRSPTLHQYMEFVEKVKRYSEEYPFEEAMTHSVDECIREDILADFFEKNRAEILKNKQCHRPGFS